MIGSVVGAAGIAVLIIWLVKPEWFTKYKKLNNPIDDEELGIRDNAE